MPYFTYIICFRTDLNDLIRYIDSRSFFEILCILIIDPNSNKFFVRKGLKVPVEVDFSCF